MRVPFEIRFWYNVDKSGPPGHHFETHEDIGPCWLWFGAVGKNGYGYFYRGQRDGRDHQVLAHRFAYEISIGPIEQPQLDHLCRVRRCVNPAHLEPVTAKTNNKRGCAARPKRTHCGNGHEWTPGNIYTKKNGGRACKRCSYDVGAAREKRKTAERTHCKHGHLLDASSTTPRGEPRRKRFCPTCRAERWNTRRGPRNTHCKHGHEMAGENVIEYTNPTTGALLRFCRACRRAANQKKKAA